MIIKTSIQDIYSLRGRLIARSREVSKSRDFGLDISNRSEIWQAPRQQRCQDVCQISDRYDYYSNQSRGFEISRDLSVRGSSAQSWRYKIVTVINRKPKQNKYMKALPNGNALLAFCEGKGVGVIVEVWLDKRLNKWSNRIWDTPRLIVTSL